MWIVRDVNLRELIFAVLLGTGVGFIYLGMSKLVNPKATVLGAAVVAVMSALVMLAVLR